MHAVSPSSASLLTTWISRLDRRYAHLEFENALVPGDWIALRRLHDEIFDLREFVPGAGGGIGFSRLIAFWQRGQDYCALSLPPGATIEDAAREIRTPTLTWAWGHDQAELTAKLDEWVQHLRNATPSR